MTTGFKRELAKRNSIAGHRRWVFVPEDQLTHAVGPLSREEPARLGIVLIESSWKAARRPYHKQKLALLWANLRHFALEQAERGISIRYLMTDRPYQDTLMPVVKDLGPLVVMEPAERELRADLAPLVKAGSLQVLPHEGWLTTHNQFLAGAGLQPPWRMDRFYRHVRRDTNILMAAGQPMGGRFSFDVDNRRPWTGKPPAPELPRFEPDALTREVGALIERQYAHHPGTLDLGMLPASHSDAQLLWAWARQWCLPSFGPYEDAMTVRSTGLFHTRLSALLNMHRLVPIEVLQEALALPIPLASKEAFVRQILGWREFVRHIHTATDGFRALPVQISNVRSPAGDAGYARWAGRSWPVSSARAEVEGSASPSMLQAAQALPRAFWGQPSGLACLDRVVADVWAEGYSHHITRLMVLANVATLLDITPREVTDWFWVAYSDAYDWVVEPNVLGMGTYALGDLMTTKPYIAGAAYINRMSDYCESCSFDPEKNCPITRLYWAFLARHATQLSTNPRMRLPLLAMKKRSPTQRCADERTFHTVLATLQKGDPLTPDNFASIITT